MEKNKEYINFWKAFVFTVSLIAVMVLFYLVVFAALKLFGVLNSELAQTIVFALSSFALLPVIFFLKKKAQISISDQFFVPAFPFVVLIVLIGFGVELVVNPLFVNPVGFFSNVRNEEIALVSCKIPTLTWTTFVIGLHGCLLAPVMEEMLFRGIFLNHFLKKYSPIRSVILSSLLFSLAHLKIDDIVSLFIFSIVVGFVYYKTRSLFLSVLLHSFTNIISSFTSFKIVAITYSSVIQSILIFIVGVIIVVVGGRLIARFSDSNADMILKKDGNYFKIS